MILRKLNKVTSMNRVKVKKTFICGVPKGEWDTWFNDHECEFSGIVEGSHLPCPFRAYMLDKQYHCTCVSAILQKEKER